MFTRHKGEVFVPLPRAALAVAPFPAGRAAGLRDTARPGELCARLPARSFQWSSSPARSRWLCIYTQLRHLPVFYPLSAL